MLLTVMTITLVMIAIAMIAIILVQRGTGATAGAAFGGGASGTVFGSQGSASFLSRSTSFLAIGFFAIALLMAVLVSRGVGAPDANEFSVIGGEPAATLETITTDAADDVPSVESSVADDIPALTPPADTAIDDVPVPTAADDSAESGDSN